MARSKAQEEIDALSATLDNVADLAEDALDPELTREELVAKVKEIADAAGVEQEDENGGKRTEATRGLLRREMAEACGCSNRPRFEIPRGQVRAVRAAHLRVLRIDEQRRGTPHQRVRRRHEPSQPRVGLSAL